MFKEYYIPYSEIEEGQCVEQEFFFRRQDILNFSEMIEDDKSFHVKEEAAHKVGFSDIIGHGAHLLALISKVIGEQLPGFGTIYISQQVEFVKPVMPESKIIVRVTVLEKKEKRRLTLRTEILDENRNEFYVRGFGTVKSFR